MNQRYGPYVSLLADYNMKMLAPEKKLFLTEVVKKHCLQYGNFELSSGAPSHYFIDASKLWTHDNLYMIADYIFECMQPFPNQVGGPTLGADPIIGALLMLAKLRGRMLSGFIVRKDGSIEGVCEPVGTFIVEDVVTTGQQAYKAVKAVEKKTGVKVLGIIGVVDRNGGAEELFHKEHYDYYPLISVRDLGL